MTDRSSSSGSGQHWLGHSQFGSIGSNSAAAGILSRVRPFQSIVENVTNTSNTRLSARSINNIVTRLAQSRTSYPQQHPLPSYNSRVWRSANSSYNSLGRYPQHPPLPSHTSGVWRDSIDTVQFGEVPIQVKIHWEVIHSIPRLPPILVEFGEMPVHLRHIQNNQGRPKNI